MDAHALLTRNWPYKVAAVFLAVLLWLNVTAEATEDFPLSTSVEVEARDSEWVVVAVDPPQVQTIFRGRRPTFMPSDKPVIREVIDTVTAPRMRLDLSARSVQGYAPELDLTPVTVEPSAVEVRLERSTTRRVPVRPDLELSAASGFTVVRPVLLQPDSVTVTGPRSQVEELTAFRTRPVQLEDLRATVSRQLELRPPTGAEHLEWDPAQIMATVQMDSLVEREVARPLLVRGPAAGGVRVSPDSVRIRLRGAARLVRAIEPGQLTAAVAVDSVPAGEASVEVTVEMPAEVRVTAEVRPVRATIRPPEGDGG